MSSKELKIFLTFLIIYSFFILWPGMGENSRFFLTRAIVDEGRLEIDSFYNQTTDRSFINGHYYSDKAPGGSFLAVPVYTIWKFAYNIFPENFRLSHQGTQEYNIIHANEEPIIVLNSPGFFVLISMILVTIFTSSVFAALTVLLIYKISRYFTKNEKQRIFLTVAFGAGTLIFHYGLVFLGHSVEAFFAFLAFYILFKIKKEEKIDSKYFLIAGASAGYAIVSGYPAGLVALGCLAYSFTTKKRKSPIFLLGLLLGVLPLLIYNFIILGSPFDLTVAHADPKILPPESKEVLLQSLGFSYFPKPLVMLQLTFLPYIGMLFYYPILIFSLLGISYMYKEYRIESILIITLFLSFIIIFSNFVDWWHGGSFGFRHIISIYPFLILPLSYLLRVGDKKSWVLLLLFLGISIFHNVIGLTGTYFDVTRTKAGLEERYIESIRKGTIFENQLYNAYLPIFLRDGPRSRMFESLITGKINIDIRSSYAPTTSGFHGVFSLLFLSTILGIIWKREIFAHFKKLSKYQKLIFISVLIFIILSIGLKVFHKKDFYLGPGWHPKAPNEEFRWVYSNSTFIINNKANFNKLIKFSLRLSSYYKERSMVIYFNDEKIDDISVSNKFELEYNWVFELNPGKNVIKIHSETCNFPFITEEGKDDERCLGIRMNGYNFSEYTENDVG